MGRPGPHFRRSMALPNFLVLGAQKAGTTSLHNYLAQHPEIFMSREKEPHYFSLGDTAGPPPPRDAFVAESLSEYERLFDRVRGEVAVGESSTTYLDSARAAGRIAERLPGVKLLAILRDPAGRAHSQYVFNRKRMLEDAPTFARALSLESQRLAAGLGARYAYRAKGFYAAQLDVYLRFFDRSQLRVYLYEDLAEAPTTLFRDIFGFLGVDEGFVPDTRLRYNVSGVPRNAAAATLLRLVGPVRPWLEAWTPAALMSRVGRPLIVSQREDPVLRRQLVEDYREDILRLEAMIGRDLAAWRSY
jgi:hypothetical protein